MSAYHELVKCAEAAFVLPDKSSEPSLLQRTIDREAGLKNLRHIPFPCIRVICRDFAVPSEGSIYKYIDCDLAIAQVGEIWQWAERLTKVYADGRRWTKYVPEEERSAKSDMIPSLYIDLLNALADRRNGFLEHPVTRQVRRAEGLGGSYRRYVIVRRRENLGCFTLGDIVRRHPKLHAVRGHLRHYRSGAMVYVRPHCRGVGEMLQIKDYAVAP